jgi:hypothetical protein
MKTNVTGTSIAAYHDPEVQAAIQTQREQVARHMLAATKAGKPSCIGSVWEHFCKLGDRGLSQKSSVSRALNEIVEAGSVVIDGVEYVVEAVAPRKFNGRVVNHYCLILPKPTPQGVQQLDLF